MVIVQQVRTAIIASISLAIVSAAAQSAPADAPVEALTPAPSAMPDDGQAQSLSLNEAIDLALKNNLNLQIQRFSRDIADYNLSASLGLYEPNLGVSYRKDSVTSEGSFNAARGSQDQDSTFQGERYNFGFTSQLPFGTRIDNLGLTLNRNESIIPVGVSEEWTTSVGIDLSQPLLRNFLIDGPRASIKINRRRVEQAGLGLRLAIMNTVTSVERAYYDLIAAHQNVEVQTQALELARKLLWENQKRVELGTMAPLEESQAKSQVASREADMLDAQNALKRQENLLKNLITDEFSQWQSITVTPSETLLFLPGQFDVQESWNDALQKRPDLLQSQIDLQISDIQLRLDKNQLFPELNIIGGYGRRGQSGRLGFPGTLNSSLNDIEDKKSPRHYYGVVLNVPLGFRQQRNNYKASVAAKRQNELLLKQFEQNILVEIDDLVRLARTNYERVQARRQARQFAEEALAAEEKKYANGISTSFVVLDLQNQLTNARFAEVQALAAYNKTIADLALAEGNALERQQIELDFE